MSDNMKKHIWLIGAGNMAVDYVKVLNNLPVKYKAIGRSKNSAQSFAEKTGIQPGIGGLDNFLQQVPEKIAPPESESRKGIVSSFY